MKNKVYSWFILFAVLSCFVAAQNVDTNTYPYIRPLPTSGATPGTTIRQTGTFNPTGYGGVPTVWDVFTGGGYRSVSNIVERDSIPVSRRKEMMLVGVTENTNVYILGPGLGNTDWKLFDFKSSYTNNIYNTDGTLAGNRYLYGYNYNLTVTNINNHSISSVNSYNNSSSLYTINVGGNFNPQISITPSSTFIYGHGGLLMTAGVGSSFSLPGTGGMRLITPNISSSGASVGQVLKLTNTNGTVEFATVLPNSVIVSTVADLVALPVSSTNATTLGYWSVGDGGGASFYWVNNQTSTNRGTKIASSISGSWVMINQDSINVKQWGAKGDGVYYDSVLINEAITYALAQSKVPPVIIPSGTYVCTNTVNIFGNNLELNLYGKLVNATNTPTYVLRIGNSPTVTAGVVTTYAARNITIDGHGSGVIDQNSITMSPWSSGNEGYHAVLAYGVNGLQFKNIIITNSIAWAFSLDLCANFDVSNCKVYTGNANGHLVSGVLSYLGIQDGIHANDSKNGFIRDNIVESGDDALAVSATRTIDAGNVVVSGNKAFSKVFAYEADGTTLNTNSPAGRFGLSCFNNALTAYCGLTNVTFANNIIDGGTGLFLVEAVNNTNTLNVPTGIKFIGNTFNGQNSIGVTNFNPSFISAGKYPVNYGWRITGGENVEFVGNTFNNISRVGLINGGSGNYIKSGTVIFRNNKFSNFSPFGGPYQQHPTETASIIWMTYGSKLIIDGNTFENNNIMPVYAGTYGAVATNAFSQIVCNNNTFINNNLRWASSQPANTNYSAALNVIGANYVEFNNNIVSTNYGHVIAARYVKALKAAGNTIQGIGNGSYTSFANAFTVYNNNGAYVNQTGIYTHIANNNIRDIDGQLLDTTNPGILTVTGNTINNTSRSYGSYLMTIVVYGNAVSDDPFTNFGGAIMANTIYRPSAQSIFYLNSSIATTGYTGYKLQYVNTNNSGNNTAETVTANANQLH